MTVTISQDIRALADAIKSHITVADGAFVIDGQAALNAARETAGVTPEQFAKVREFELAAPKAFVLAAGEICNEQAKAIGMSEVFLELPFGADPDGKDAKSKIHVTWRAQQEVPAGIPAKGEAMRTRTKYGVTTLGVIRHDGSGATTLDQVRKFVSDDMASRAAATAAAAMSS